jgi:6,7-dimethyl-8-ribityllumazine synthase
MSSLVMARTAVVATPTIEAIMKVYVRTIIPVRSGVITRIIITRIHNTPAQQ